MDAIGPFSTLRFAPAAAGSAGDPRAVSAPDGAGGGTAPRPPLAGAAPSEAAQDPASPPPSRPLDLSEEDQRRRDELAATDQAVRAHEQAHVAAGGPYAGTPSYEYEVGPDGRRYAVGGEVPIDAAPVSGDPEATIFKMRIVEAAALAPPEPSAQDRAVAAIARARGLEATAELAARRRAEAGVQEHGVSRRV